MSEESYLLISNVQRRRLFLMAQYFVLKYLINFYSNPCWGSQTCDLQHCIVATQLLTCRILQQVMIQRGEQEDRLTKEMKPNRYHRKPHFTSTALQRGEQMREAISNQHKSPGLRKGV